MASTEPLSRSELAALAGVPNDVLTFWIRRGLVVPITAPSGTGKHLRFKWYEVNIAAIMMQLRDLGVPIDGLLEIAAQFRASLTWGEYHSLSRDDVFAIWTIANIYRRLEIKYNNVDYFQENFDAEIKDLKDIWRTPIHGSQQLTPHIEQLYSAIGVEEFNKYKEDFLTIIEHPTAGEDKLQLGPELTYFWRSENGWKFRRGEDGPYSARDDGAFTTVAIDISGVIRCAWIGS